MYPAARVYPAAQVYPMAQSYCIAPYISIAESLYISIIRSVRIKVRFFPINDKYRIVSRDASIASGGRGHHISILARDLCSCCA